MLREIPKTVLEISVGAVATGRDWLRFRLSPFACGVTVLGTGTVKRTADIFVHDHPVLHPHTRSIVPGDRQNPVASYTHPDRGLVIERFDPRIHGDIDWSTWKKADGITHTHIPGGSCFP